VVSALLGIAPAQRTRRRAMERNPKDMPAEDDVIGESDEEIIGADDDEFDEDEEDTDEEDDDSDKEEA
jgi:hypothetical protein